MKWIKFSEAKPIENALIIAWKRNRPYEIALFTYKAEDFKGEYNKRNPDSCYGLKRDNEDEWRKIHCGSKNNQCSHIAQGCSIDKECCNAKHFTNEHAEEKWADLYSDQGILFIATKDSFDYWTYISNIEFPNSNELIEAINDINLKCYHD